LRKGLFAIVLVLASFAGGAAVNGPGLRWVRDMVLNQPGVEITTTTTTGGDPAGDPQSEPGASSGAGAGVAPVAEIPSRPIPPLVLPPEPIPPSPPVLASAVPTRSPAVASKSNSEPPWTRAPAPPRPTVPETPEKAPGEKASEASIPIATASASAIEPPAPLPMARERNTDSVPVRPIAAAAPVDRDINRAVLPSSPAPAPPLGEVPTEPPTSPAAAGTGTAGLDDWGAIRRKMRALGVARFEIEGEPEGRVRFSCVIPLAGRRAVSQHFEGEGSDELEAAQTALRRVALWRATEPSASPSASQAPALPPPTPASPSVPAPAP
jgi:hypothetical protein